MDNKKMILQTIGNNLRDYRLAMKMTQDEVAEKAGLSTPFYANLERGVKGMSIFTLVELSHTLGISVDFLLSSTNRRDGRINNICAMLQNQPDHLVALAERLIALLVESQGNAPNDD